MATSNHISSIPKILVCPVCVRVFSTPKRLPCSHTCCQQCISTIQTQEGAVIKCSQCQSEHKLCSQTVHDLPDNNLVRDLLQFSENLARSCVRQTSDGLAACHVCQDSSEPNEAELFCKQCEKMMCRECNKRHKKGDRTKFHKVETLHDIAKLFMGHSTREQLKTEYCNVHPRKRLKYFCNSCKTTLCRLCKETEHNKEKIHKVFRVKESNEKEREKLQKGLKKMKKKIPVIRKHQQSLRTFDQQLDQDKKEATEKLKEQVQNIIDIIWEKESALLEELNNLHREDKQLIKSRLQNSEDVLSNLSQTIDLTARVLKEENEIDFLAISGSASDAIQALLDEKFEKSTEKSGVCFEFTKNTDMERLLHCEAIGALHKTKILSNLTPKTEKQKSQSSRSDVISFSLIQTIGGSGKAEGQMASPHGLTVTSQGDVLLADRHNNRVQILERSGDYKNHFELENLSRRFDPVDVAVLDSRRVAVSDANNKNIHIVDIADSLTAESTSSSDNECKLIASFANSQLSNPAGVCVDDSGSIFVADKTSIKKISTSGNIEKTIGSSQRGQEPGQFDDIWCVTTNSKGQLLVCDTGNQRIQLLDSEGEFLKQFGEKDKPFNTPRGIAVDKSDNMFVTSNHCVQMMSSEGKLICRVDDDDDKLKWPCGVAVIEDDSQLLVFVADAGNHCIRVYQGHSGN